MHHDRMAGKAYTSEEVHYCECSQQPHLSQNENCLFFSPIVLKHLLRLCYAGIDYVVELEILLQDRCE